jgi:serine/threonine-protein kinase RsbW
LVQVGDSTVVRVPAAPGGVEQARAALDGFCTANGIAAGDAWRLKVSLDEALANVVRHGRPPAGADVAVAMRLADGTVELTVSDAGPAFNPLEMPAPDRRAPLAARSPGGVGIVLVRALMDDVEYVRQGGLNVLTLRKRL